MVYRPMSIGYRYNNSCLEGTIVMARPKKEKIEDIFWAPPAKEYKDLPDGKAVVKAKRKRLLNQYIKLYFLADVEFTKKDQYLMDRLVAKHIPD